MCNIYTLHNIHIHSYSIVHAVITSCTSCTVHASLDSTLNLIINSVNIRTPSIFKMVPLLPVLLLLIGSPRFSPQLVCEASEFYVTPTQPPNPACPDEKPCYTLSDYASNESTLLNSEDNVSLLFLDGQHILTNQSLELSNIHNLTISGANDYFSPQATIQAIVVSISNVSVLIMQNISITLVVALDSRYNMLISNVGHLIIDAVVITNTILHIESPISTRVSETYFNNASTPIKLTIEGCLAMNSTIRIYTPEHYFEGEMYDMLVHGGGGLIFIVCEGQLTVKDSSPFLVLSLSMD